MSKQSYRDQVTNIIAINRNITAAYVRDKMKPVNPMQHIDVSMMQEGENKFLEGISLDDLTDDLKNNYSFMHGYKRAETISQAKIDYYDLGVKKYVDGVSYEELSEILQNNKDFMQGYRDAQYQSLIDGVDWPMYPSKDDIEMFKAGKRWFHDGLSIDNAPDNKKYNSYFVNGFNTEMEVMENKLANYDLGMQKFIDGIAFKDNSREQQKDRSFVQGYRDAQYQSLIDGVDWKNVTKEYEIDENDNHHVKGRR